jgi:hypothetical protein
MPLFLVIFLYECKLADYFSLDFMQKRTTKVAAKA